MGPFSDCRRCRCRTMGGGEDRDRSTSPPADRIGSDRSPPGSGLYGATGVRQALSLMQLLGRLFAEACDHVGAALGVALDVDQREVVGLLEEMGEAAVAVVTVVERRLLALHRILDHGCVEHLVI